MIATGSWDSDVRLWNVATGKELAMLTGHKASVLNYAFSPDGRTLATKCDDRAIKFWRRSGKSLPFPWITRVPSRATFSPFLRSVSTMHRLAIVAEGLLREPFRVASGLGTFNP